MTRETKIGLLVGLAFIIVVGLLLQDQINRTVEPPPAQLGQVADNVRRGTGTPSSNHPPVQHVVSPQNVAPSNPVRTREEIVPPAPPVMIVDVRPGMSSPIHGINGSNNINPGHNAPIAINGNNAPVRPAPGDRPMIPDGTRTLEEVARTMGEPVVTPDGQPLRATLPQPAPVDPMTLNPFAPRSNNGSSTVNASGTRQYKAEPGDNLNRIAQKCYNANTKALRDLIVKANTSLTADPNKIVIGQTYVIPPAPTGGSTPVAGSTPVPGAGNNVTQPSRAAAGETWYTVKQGDTLTRIAREQCGDANLVAAIKELNKDKLQGGDRIVVDMKLRLPGRAPVASVN